MFCFKSANLEWDELWENVIDSSAAGRLELLHSEFNPLYVISSSWASYLDRTQMGEVFKRTKLEFVNRNLHENWRTFQSNEYDFQGSKRGPQKNRYQEIENWLSLFKIAGQPFVVIDDIFSGESLIDSCLASEGNVVLCRMKIGFNESKLQEARQVLLNQRNFTNSKL